jgi:alpha-amylase/alpha-mannosidase (GH57 family)
MKTSKTKYVCIHGHFYQPPRENPWIEAIEREESAAPYHDWNERINLECYRANTAARLVDDKNCILNLRNNFNYFSFNFGPTLIHWLEDHDPWTYRAILNADKESCRVHKGHGNAIAQVYNHIIMPLANQRDKVTQVQWGIRDFEWRFGRRPEGMWLAETAADRDTLTVLAEAGIKFTILSPYQAARWRFKDETQWRDAGGGVIPTGRAYRYNCSRGKHIDLFFYDPALARGIAFERLLEHSGRLLEQIDRTNALRDPESNEPWLVNVATDGESYGHHFKFGDMALAAAFQELERDPSTEITTYASFLASFPVVAEVEIFEKTAWSCSHGLGRWSDDCGCHIGGEPGWDQKWRAPLRAAVNFVRDKVALHFESEMGKLCKDPWKARDEYIHIVLDRKKFLEGFLQKHMQGPANPQNVPRFLEMLEMQRFSLLMFTSCGWFFDEISQLEATLILKYAARTMQLAAGTGAKPMEPGFLDILKQAPSNMPEYENGADVFLKKVKPDIIEKNRVAANYTIQSIARNSNRQFQIYTYGILPQKEEDLGANPVPCLFGHISVKNDRTLAEQDFLYAVMHFGGLDLRSWIKTYENENEYACILTALQDCVEDQNTSKMVRVLDEKFGTEYFGLHDVFKDLRSSIALEISRKTLGYYTDLQRSLFHTYKPLFSSLRQWGIRIPSDLRVSLRRILSDEAEQLVVDILGHEHENTSAWDSTDFYYRAHVARLNSILEDARIWDITLHLGSVSNKLGQALTKSIMELAENFDPAVAGRLFRLITIGKVLGVKPEIWKLQTLYFEFATRGARNPELLARISNIERFMDELDAVLWCSFSRFLKEIPVSFSRELTPIRESRAVARVRRHSSD